LWNGLYDTKIRIGQELRVERKVTNKQQKENQTHTVVLGETLYQISRRYAVSVADIQHNNGLKGNEIKVGQVLSIP
jgi:LysM repeat protein